MNERFKEIRLINKLSQEEFGKKIGIESRGHISTLENGTRNITDRTIRDVCREFNINEEWLRTGNGKREKDAYIGFGDICLEIGENDPKAREAIAKYYELSPKDKKLFWKFVERFVKIEAED